MHLPTTACARRRLVLLLAVLSAFVISLAGGSLFADDKPPEKDKPAGRKDKPTGKKEKPATPTVDEVLKQKLKEHEDAVLKIRQEMVKACDEAIARAQEAVKKATKDQEEAKKAGNKEAAKTAGLAVKKAVAEERMLSRLKDDILHRIQVGAELGGRKTRDQARLGVHFAPLDPVVVSQLGLAEGIGVVVHRLDKDSVAAKAGLRQHDIVLKLDDKPVPADMPSVRKLIGDIKPGTTFVLVVRRQGKEETVKLTMPGGK